MNNNFRLIGLNSKKRYKKVLTIIYYTFVVLYFLSIIFISDELAITRSDKIIKKTNEINILLMLIFPYLIMCNIFNVKDKIPLYNSKKKGKNIIAIIITVILFSIISSFLTNCLSDEYKERYRQQGNLSNQEHINKNPIDEELTRITIKDNNKQIPIGEKYLIKFETNIEDDTYKGYEFESSNEEIATIEDGYITGRQEGKVEISIEGKNNIKTKAIYEIIFVKLDSIKINIKDGMSNKINVGETIFLNYELSPKNSNDTKITWHSSDPDIISIDGDGKVTAKAFGEVEITAISQNNVKSKIKLKAHNIYNIEYNELGKVGRYEEYEGDKEVFYFLPTGTYEITKTFHGSDTVICNLWINYNKKIPSYESYTYNLKEKLNFTNVKTYQVDITSDVHIVNLNNCNYKLTRVK